MAGAGAPTWPPRFIPGVRQQLVSNIPGLDRNLVFRSNWTPEHHLLFPPADRFITLFMPEFPVDAPGVSGGGKYTTGFESTLLLRAFVRLESDIEGWSQRQFDDAVDGVDEFLRLILASLQTYMGEADESTTLRMFKRPMRIRRFHIESKNGKAESRWTLATMNYEVAFVADLGQNYTSIA